MNKKLDKIFKKAERLAIDDNTKIFGTHISHNGNPYHEEAENRAIKNGYHIAYDGMELGI